MASFKAAPFLCLLLPSLAVTAMPPKKRSRTDAAAAPAPAAGGAAAGPGAALGPGIAPGVPAGAAAGGGGGALEAPGRPGGLSHLPDDALLSVAGFLGMEDLENLVTTSKAFGMHRDLFRREARAAYTGTTTVDMAAHNFRSLAGFKELRLENLDRVPTLDHPTALAMTSLTHLEIAGDIPLHKLQPFLLCPNLQRVYLDGRIEPGDPAVARAFWEALAPGQRFALQELDAAGGQWDDTIEDDMDLRPLLRRAPLRSLNLLESDLSTDDGTFGTRVLEALPAIAGTIEELTLCINGLANEDDFARLCDALGTMANLRTLRLASDGRDFSDAETLRLGQALARLPHLTSLDLGGMLAIQADPEAFLAHVPPTLTHFHGWWRHDLATWRRILDRLPNLVSLELHLSDGSEANWMTLVNELSRRAGLRRLSIMDNENFLAREGQKEALAKIFAEADKALEFALY